MPLRSNAPTPAPGWLRGRPIAHRGLHDMAAGRPENSLAAFEAAAARGFPVELDVHGLADGTPAVFHDATLARLTGRPGRIGDLTPGDLPRHTLLGTDQTIPTLDDVLELAGARVPLLIEVKQRSRPDPRPDPLWPALAARLARHAGPAALQSFDVAALRWFRRHAPALPRGLLAGTGRHLPPASRALHRSAAATPLAAPHFLGVALAIAGTAPIRAWRAAGLPVLVWGIFTPADYAAARPLADNRIFEGFDPGG